MQWICPHAHCTHSHRFTDSKCVCLCVCQWNLCKYICTRTHGDNMHNAHMTRSIPMHRINNAIVYFYHMRIYVDVLLNYFKFSLSFSVSSVFSSYSLFSLSFFSLCPLLLHCLISQRNGHHSHIQWPCSSSHGWTFLVLNFVCQINGTYSSTMHSVAY